MPVKLDPEIVSELAEMELVIWSAKHLKKAVYNEDTGKTSFRENKDWVIVEVAGPGFVVAIGSGKTLRAAVDNILWNSFSDRVPGIRGTMMRLEKELWSLFMVCMELKYELDPDLLDDTIPF